MKKQCYKCDKIAKWRYMPGGFNYCNVCVPRGCSCQMNDTGGWDPGMENEPCCEYEFFPEGWEDDDTDEE